MYMYSMGRYGQPHYIQFMAAHKTKLRIHRKTLNTLTNGHSLTRHTELVFLEHPPLDQMPPAATAASSGLFP